MIRVIYTMLVIVNKNLKVKMSNYKLFLGKSAITFKLLVQKKEICKQMAGRLYYKY